jgi:hypothetical protein
MAEEGPLGEFPELTLAQIAEIRAASASKIMGLRWPLKEEHTHAARDAEDH